VATTPVLQSTAPRRPLWRSYLLLSRVSNLPTVWSNVLAGIVASHAVVRPPHYVRLAIAVSLLYTAGMFLNDAFDRDIDAVERPDRPIPAGEVSAATVFTIGFALLAAGVVLAALQPTFLMPLVWSLLLAAAIVRYDYRHKRHPFAPIIMGLCRGLVYCVAASAVAGAVAPAVLIAAVGLTAYVASLTQVAKRLGPRAGIVIPLLIAGISIYDALVVGVSGGSAALIVAAAAGFPLTLVAQRIVPGT